MPLAIELLLQAAKREQQFRARVRNADVAARALAGTGDSLSSYAWPGNVQASATKR
jgi:propionate catabolism operon transcriptional regulator